MDFKLVFAEAADKELSKLPMAMTQRIFTRCKKTKSDPMRYWEKVTDGDEYKFRVGDYRAIADIDFELKRIEIIKVGHRKNVYKK